MRSLGDDEEEERSNNLTQPNPIISFETPTIRNILERTLFAVSRNHKIRSINDVEEEGENLNSDKTQTKFGFKVLDLKTLVQVFDSSQVWVEFWSVFFHKCRYILERTFIC